MNRVGSSSDRSACGRIRVPETNLVKQLLQPLHTGKVEVVEVPVPVAGPGRMVIRTRVSLISPGTERMLVEFGYCNAGEVIAVGEGGGL